MCKRIASEAPPRSRKNRRFFKVEREAAYSLSTVIGDFSERSAETNGEDGNRRAVKRSAREFFRKPIAFSARPSRLGGSVAT